MNGKAKPRRTRRGGSSSESRTDDQRFELRRLLKPADVARKLGVSRTWLYEAAKDGRIPCVRLGGPDGPVRFIEADLERWLDEARASWRPGDSSTDTLRRTVRRPGYADVS